MYELILKACLTLTGATRGLYVTAAGEEPEVHIRAAIDVNDYPASPPSRLIMALTRAALHDEGTQAYADTSALPEAPAKGESFRNCLVAPVVLRNDRAVLLSSRIKRAAGSIDPIPRSC